MKSKYKYETKEMNFSFLMQLKNVTCKVNAIANVDEIVTQENIYKGTERPEYIDVYTAHVDGKEIKDDETLRTISDKLTERLIKNASLTWFATDAPRLFREEFDKALAHRHDLTL